MFSMALQHQIDQFIADNIHVAVRKLESVSNPSTD